MFFQNPFTQDFRGNLVLGDRHYSPTFIVPQNTGRGETSVFGWSTGPYDLSGNDSDGNATNVLTLNYSFDASNFTAWTPLTVTLTTGAKSTAAVQPYEVAASLNGNPSFTAWFSATLDKSTPTSKVMIAQNAPATRFKFFISNGAGEEKIRFNARAGVAQIPSYFARHVYNQATTYPDCVALLVNLTPGTYTVDANVITNATDAKGVNLGLSSTVLSDWQLFKGKSGLFNFTKQTLDGSGRVTSIIEYPAGAVAGDFAKKTTMSYTGAATTASQITELPYTLASGDLVTPS